MSVKLEAVVVDSVRPEELASFWCAVLSWRVVGREDDGAVEIGGDDASQLTLLFQPVAEAKQVKNRLHFDLRPLGSDQTTELARLLELGACHADVGQGDETWIVLADPEGNEFCLLGTPTPA